MISVMFIMFVSVILSREDGEGSQDSHDLRDLRSFGLYGPQDDEFVFPCFPSLRSAASRRANSRNGTAGMPMTFVPSGTSSSTALFAATCTRLPIFKCPENPDCPATAT